jgi:hypothetical protein
LIESGERSLDQVFGRHQAISSFLGHRFDGRSRDRKELCASARRKHRLNANSFRLQLVMQRLREGETSPPIVNSRQEGNSLIGIIDIGKTSVCWGWVLDPSS